MQETWMFSAQNNHEPYPYSGKQASSLNKSSENAMHYASRCEYHITDLDGWLAIWFSLFLHAYLMIYACFVGAQFDEFHLYSSCFPAS